MAGVDTVVEHEGTEDGSNLTLSSGWEQDDKPLLFFYSFFRKCHINKNSLFE